MYVRGIGCEHRPVTSSDADREAAAFGGPQILATRDRPPGDRLSVAGQRIAALPPASFFVISAIFHYVGPSFAVLLFAHVSVLGVAWLRIASAAVVFALWRRPWRLVQRLTRRQRWVLLALGVVLAAMNSLFYLAIARLPLSTVGAIEFLGIVILAAVGTRTRRNILALVLAVGGVVALTDIRIVDEPTGFPIPPVRCSP